MRACVFVSVCVLRNLKLCREKKKKMFCLFIRSTEFDHVESWHSRQCTTCAARARRDVLVRPQVRYVPIHLLDLNLSDRDLREFYLKGRIHRGGRGGRAGGWAGRTGRARRMVAFQATYATSFRELSLLPSGQAHRQGCRHT